MKEKVIKKYIYEGLGFPVILKNVPMIEVMSEMVIHVNFNDLQKAVILHLCHKKTPLTGLEIKFVRTYFEMTTMQFGAKFGLSHAAVLKWEKHKDHFAKIEPTTEVCIRLFMLGHLERSSNAFKKLYEEIDIFHLAECQKSTESSEMILIDVPEELAI